MQEPSHSFACISFTYPWPILIFEAEWSAHNDGTKNGQRSVAGWSFKGHGNGDGNGRCSSVLFAYSSSSIFLPFNCSNSNSAMAEPSPISCKASGGSVVFLGLRRGACRRVRSAADLLPSAIHRYRDVVAGAAGACAKPGSYLFKRVSLWIRTCFKRVFLSPACLVLAHHVLKKKDAVYCQRAAR